jgi:predicted Zn-ribbon and HTH transcriptional regulator
MKVDIYDSRDNCINTIENAEEVESCKDGRHLITYPKKCETCGHIEDYIWQIP